MNQTMTHSIPANFSAQSKIWIYQSSRAFTSEETAQVNAHLKSFTTKWASHQRQLTAHGEVLHQRFLVLLVDDLQGSGASGCSIDASVHFVEELGNKYEVDLFDRMTFAYMDGAAVETVTQAELSERYAAGTINDQTLFFDNLVKTYGDFKAHWLVPLGQSWHRRFVRK